ncbi:single-stranded DNA-binding protein [Pseudoxanthomonas putridarboris]|uniref:Single-stranded DNA-binding protein n=1 Tax=Pseudoxanthomonas putridarboris TaxID=752605 RepID=A0ABU9IZI9_9GAMM
MDGIRIEVASAKFETIKGKSNKTGKDYEINRQEAFLHKGGKYPDRFEITLPNDPLGVKPLSPGFYTLSSASIMVNPEYRQLEISRYDAEYVRLPEGEQGEYAVKPSKAA